MKEDDVFSGRRLKRASWRLQGLPPSVRHDFTLRGIYNMLVGNPVLAEELKAIGKDDVFGTNVSYLSGRAPAPFREGMAGTVKKRSCC